MTDKMFTVRLSLVGDDDAELAHKSLRMNLSFYLEDAANYDEYEYMLALKGRELYRDAAYHVCAAEAE